MKRFSLWLALFTFGLVLMGANGCSSDPNVEGAKLDLRNKDYDRALENINTALEKNPANAEALRIKGDILLAQAEATPDRDKHIMQVEQAIEAYRAAAAADPEMDATVKQAIDFAYAKEMNRGVQAFNRAANAESEEGFVESASYFGLASSIAPDSSAPYVNQAFALMRGGQMEPAIEPLEMAIDKGEDDADTYIMLGSLYASFDRGTDAVEVLEQAAQKYPDNVELQSQLLNAYNAAGMSDRALDRYKDAVAREPDNKLYRYNYGSLLLEMEDYDGAIEQLEQAVRVDPDYANAQYNLGAAYVNKAVDANERLTELDDKLRAEKASMAAADVQKMEQEMEQLAERRRSLFQQAVGPLEKAKILAEAEGGEVGGICQALFSAYVQTGQQDKAESISECAGYDLN